MNTITVQYFEKADTLHICIEGRISSVKLYDGAQKVTYGFDKLSKMICPNEYEPMEIIINHFSNKDYEWNGWNWASHLPRLAILTAEKLQTDQDETHKKILKALEGIFPKPEAANPSRW